MTSATRSRKSRRRSGTGTRAKRFALHVPVQYRAHDGRWRRGTTEIISRSGLLLRAEESVKPNTAVDMIVELPALPGERPARLVCSGRVVRTFKPGTRSSAPVLAATISWYRFGRAD